MSIHVTCTGCGKTYLVAEALAGKSLRCKACGGAVNVPNISAPGNQKAGEFDLSPLKVPPFEASNSLRRDEGASPPVANYESAPVTGERTLSRERQLAARSCFWLAGLQFFASTCLGIALFAPLISGARTLSPSSMVVTLIVLGCIVGSMVTHIVCGISIRKNGFAAVIVALLLAGLEGFIALFLLVGAIVLLKGTFSNTRAIVLGLISLLAIAAFGQLIYFLVKILMESRRQAP